MLNAEDNAPAHPGRPPTPPWATTCAATGSPPSSPRRSPLPIVPPSACASSPSPSSPSATPTAASASSDNYCPHRRASLFFGRNEESGLRCVYHGWKFDHTGACVDMPSEPAESNFRDKVRIAAYPCEERGGVVWAYMGPPELTPEVPDLAWASAPDSHRYLSKCRQECNWLQALEGGIDSSHISFLHSSLKARDYAHQRLQPRPPGHRPP